MALENLGNKFKALANVAAKKTGEAVELTKINLNITTLQGECDEIYRRIGVQVYTEIAKGAVHSGDVVELSRQISEKLFEIGQLRDKINDVKSGREEQAPYTQPVDVETAEPLYTAPMTVESETYVEVEENQIEEPKS